MFAAALAGAVAVGSGAAVAAGPVVAQAPVPSSAMRGQNATPVSAPSNAGASQEVALSRLHHAAQREMRLGDLGQIDGAMPQVQRYGADLTARFRAYDQRVLALATERGISEARLSAAFAGENVDALRRETEDLGRLEAQRGAAFERAYWAAVVQEQSAAADMAATVTAKAPDPSVRRLVADLAGELDRASRVALAAVRSQSAEVGAPAAAPVDTGPAAPNAAPAVQAPSVPGL
jgi:hypothetical protein